LFPYRTLEPGLHPEGRPLGWGVVSQASSHLKEIGTMESKPAQNIQDTFLNTVRKDKTPITIYLVSGVKLTGKIRSFDKYSVLLENNAQEQLIFKHAISTVVSGRAPSHAETKTEARAEARPEARVPGGPSPAPPVAEAAAVAGD
jgi:host factor-I protein